MKLNFKKILGYAVLLWIIMFVVASIFVGFNVGESLWAQIIMWIIVIIAVWILVGLTGAENVKTGLIIGIVFIVIGVILDLIVTVRFTGMELFSTWEIWASYGLTFIVSILRGSTTKSQKLE